MNTNRKTRNPELETSPFPWLSLEHMRGLKATPAVWRRKLGPYFDTFSRAFLQVKPPPARFCPCRKCGCASDITIFAPDDIVPVCKCEPWNGQNLILALANLQILELNWSRFSRALCQAFALNPKSADLGLDNTRQIGSWGADAVPVILTIQHSPHDLNYVIMALATRLRQKFILLSPTNKDLNATVQETLANVGAALFPLDAHLTLTQNGTFQPTKAPGEIFARFTPQPKEPVQEDTARQAFALIKALESEQPKEKAPAYTVFRLYCMEGLTAKQVARKCGCARSLVFTRLKLLGQKLGRNPADLRPYSSHLQKIEDSLHDSRARRIHRPTAPIPAPAASTAPPPSTTTKILLTATNGVEQPLTW